MAASLLQEWCRGLEVDARRALLVTSIPEGLQEADIEATLRPTFLPLGSFQLRNVSALGSQGAKAALVEFAEDIDPAAVPREIPGKDGVWRVLWKDVAQDARVLTQMKRLLLDERPAEASGDTAAPRPAHTQVQGSGEEAGKAGAPGGAARNPRRGRRGGRNRGKKRGRGGRPAGSGSEDSSDESLGIVIEEIQTEDLGGDQDPRALYTTLQAAAKELNSKWAFPEDADEDRPREFLALVTVTDKTKKREKEKEPPEAEAVCSNTREARRGVPDLVALLAVRDSEEEEPIDSDASGSESQENWDEENEGVDNPEFVAIVAYTDPSDPSAREEMLKIASVMESLGWTDKKDKKDPLHQILSVMSKDTSGPRVKVEEAGLEVDAMVLRKAEEDGSLLECISTLAEPDSRPKGKKAPRGLRWGWGIDGEDEVGLLELVALLAAQDMAEAGKGEESPWGGGQCKHAKGHLAEVLALLAARENVESNEDSEEPSNRESEAESEDSESEESEPDDSASKKPRAKRARTGSKGLAQPRAPAVPTAPRARRTRRGGRGRGRGRGVTPEKKAGAEAPTGDDAAGNKKKGPTGPGARARAGEAKGQLPAGPKSARGKKARRGRGQPPKCH